MAYSLTRWPESRILVIRGSGTGSLEEGLAILDALASQALVADPIGVLFDLRLLEYVPSAEEARQIAASYGAFGVQHRLRMAYLASAGAQYGVARMVQSLSENHGVAASVFTTVEPAIRWLSSDVSAMGA
jgi:hypothetical protein